MVRTMLLDAQLPSQYWAEAVNTAVFINNHMPTKANNGLLPYEMWTGCQPNLSHVHVFRCRAPLHVPAQLCTKLQARTCEAIYVGPARDNNEDIFLTPDLNNIDLNSLPLLVNNSDLYSMPLSQMSQPGPSGPASSPCTHSQSSPMLTPSHSMRARLQPSPVTTPSVHMQRTPSSARRSTPAFAQRTLSPTRTLIATSVPTLCTPMPNAPSRTAVPIAQAKKCAHALLHNLLLPWRQTLSLLHNTMFWAAPCPLNPLAPPAA